MSSRSSITSEKESITEQLPEVQDPSFINTAEQSSFAGSPDSSKDLGNQEEDELLVSRDSKTSTTNGETLIHFLKCNVGTGILAMPEAFMNAGLWVGLAGIPIIGAICIHCMFTLVQCSKVLCKKRKVLALSYEETGKAAFEYGPPKLRKFAKFAPYVITTFLTMTQLGFCCVYFVFIPQNLKQAIDCMGETGTGISQLGFMAIMIVPLLLVSFVPSLKYLAPLSMIAGVVQTAGIVIIFYYTVRDLPDVQEQVPAFNSWATLPLYFGSAIYAFEGIGLVLPLENQMKNPEDLLGLSGVLGTATFFVVCLYAGVGFFGYLYYGNSVLGAISLNLPPREGLAQAVKITMSIAVFLTYPLQIYVVFQMIKPTIDRHFKTEKMKIIADYATRIVIVLFTFALAAAIPNIGLFISLVGALSSSTLSLIFPPIIDMLVHWDNRGKYNWRIVKGVLICIFGLIGFATGTATSIKGIVDFFVNGEEGPSLGC